MTFQNPAGLWLLLGVPLLILIYIIKSRHEDRAVYSTFIWKLSDKFMKKRIPLQKLRRVLSFALQLMIIVTAAALAAQPAVAADEGSEYVVIIDGSAGMPTENSKGVSRFDRACELIENTTEQTGARVSVILASSSASYIVQRCDSQTELRLALKNAACGCADSDIDGAIALAQLLCNKYPVTDVILYTDRNCASAENITVENLNENEPNVSVTSLTYTASGKTVTFTGNVSAVGYDTATLALRIDGKITDAQSVDVSGGDAVVTFTREGAGDFETAELFTDADDALSVDNSYSVCRKVQRDDKVLIVSDTPLYLQSVFVVMDGCETTTAGTQDATELSGYSLYVFDGYMPETLPKDGSVWLINSLAAPTGVVYGDEVQTDDATLSSIVADTDANATLTTELKASDISVSSYIRLSCDGTWETVLVCGEDAVLLCREETTGMKTVMTAFDLHDSNLPLLSNFVVLVRNILDYSVPEILASNDYSVGETVRVNVLPDCALLYASSPDGDVNSLSAGGEYALYTPKTPGVYSVTETYSDGTSATVSFFAHIPSSETNPEDLGALSLSLTEPDAVQTEEKTEKDIRFWFACAFLALLLAEWGVYYSEQF